MTQHSTSFGPWLRLAAACALFLVPGLALAQAGSSAAPTSATVDADAPTGILAVDIRNGLRAADRDDERPMLATPESTGRKSVVLAGALSAVLPGAGQLYAQAPWWRTALYGTIEVVGWTLYGVYNAKGNRATNDFQIYADAHWDVTRYIDWVGANYQEWSDLDVNKQAVQEALGAIYTSHDPSLQPWQRVDFSQLNKLERAVNGGFSHTLPAHGDQQYYEEIGKYFQYRSGWDDHPAAGDTAIFNPAGVSQHNHDYVAQREHANALGAYASTALGVVVLNHIVSLIDAALEARSYNLSVHSDVHGTLLPDGTRILTTSLGMTIRF